MRLLHSTEWRFQEFFDNEIPRYAILSHRWGPDEVSYQSLQSAIREMEAGGEPRLSGRGFLKIQNCRRQAAMDQYEWVWIDTCSINKESSAELSEAINSMYRWYCNAKTCYVYLADVQEISAPPFYEGELQDEGLMLKIARERALEDFKKSEWFSRGWTLQELLAPVSAVFYSTSWKFFNTRDNLAQVIHAITGIDPELLHDRGRLDLLRGSSRLARIASTSAAMKMSWLASRKTSRVEDMAYCMLGLFNANMPLLYGEGSKAFLRLQLEIINNTDDESIFAWGIGGPGDNYLETGFGMLARTPSLFANSGRVENYKWWERPIARLPYAMTNQGLRFDVEASRWNQGREQEHEEPGSITGRKKAFSIRHFRLDLNCFERSGPIGALKRQVVVYLGQLAAQSKQWARVHCRLVDIPIAGAEGAINSTLVTLYVRQADKIYINPHGVMTRIS
jgi:hypothetical protein